MPALWPPCRTGTPDKTKRAIVRPVMRGLLSHTQLPEDSIHWLDLVINWNEPWPADHAPEGGWL